MERLFGLETEYALTVLDRHGHALDRRDWASRMVALACRGFRCLKSHRGSGVFMENGARLYVDTGGHPEFATPECSGPWQLVSHAIAGDRILARLAGALETDGSGKRVLIHKANVDYVSGNTWGCHESYLHRADPDRLRLDLVPHLVSRVCYCGAGGMTPHGPAWGFVLSPRAFWFQRVVSSDSTHHRGIYHTKNESLSRPGLNRLHVLVGDSLCSQTSIFLKIAATGLVVAMAEAGVGPGRQVQLRFPVRALHAFAGDPTCAATTSDEGGNAISAIAVQRHYLRQAERCAGEPFMPPWTEDACAIWRRTLDALEADPRSMERTLDWAIKRRLFERHAARRGWTAGGLSGWSEVVTRADAALRSRDLQPTPEAVLEMLSPQTPPDPLAAVLRRQAEAMGLSWRDAAAFFELRDELREIDLRFSQLGPQGLFESLDGPPGLLDHRLVGRQDVERAVHTPPALGRAKLRGECVRRFASRASRYACDWDVVWDLEGSRMLDLSDPFTQREEWTETEKGSAAESTPESLLRMLNARLRCSRRGQAAAERGG